MPTPQTRNNYPTRPKTNARPRMQAWVNEYVAYCRRKQESPRTVKGREDFLNRFAEWWDDQILDPRKLDAELLIDYWGEISCEWAGSSYNTYRNRMRSFLKWLMTYPPIRLDAGNSLALMECIEVAPENKRQLTWLSATQMAEVIESAGNAYDRAVLSTLVYTLCRRGTLAELTVGSIKLDLQQVHLYNVKSRKPLVHFLSPPFEREMREWFTEYSTLIGRNLEDSDPLIPRRQNRLFPDRAIDAVNVTPLVKKYTKPYVTQTHDGGPHTLRRSGSQAVLDALLAKDIPLKDALSHLQALLGHVKVDTTLRYLQTTYADMESREAMRQLGTFIPDLRAVTPIRRVEVG